VAGTSELNYQLRGVGYCGSDTLNVKVMQTANGNEFSVFFKFMTRDCVFIDKCKQIVCVTYELTVTRQHSYRKEDRAMRPIYGCT